MTFRPAALSALFVGAFVLLTTSLAAQTASVTEGCAPLTVNFTAPGGATTFFWEFQNGATSTLANPSTVYTEPGIYMVNFRAVQGGTVLGTVTVEVRPRPVPMITADTTQGCLPLTVQFNNTSTVDPNVTINQVNWTFGDGSGSQVTDPVYTYTTAGSFDVSLRLEAAEPGCSITGSFEDFITVNQVLPTFTVSPEPPAVCDPPLTVTFTNTTGGGLDFRWDLGNGETFVGVNPPPQTYTQPGSYPVTLTATDSLGCVGTFTRTVVIGRPVFQFGIPDTVCVDEMIRLENNTLADNFVWTFPPQTQVFNPNTARPTVTFLQEGSYQIRVQALAGQGCSADTTITVYADQADAGFTTDPSFSCQDSLIATFTANSTEATSFEWTFETGDMASGRTVDYTYVFEDPTIYGENGLERYLTTLIVTNPSGCQDSVTRADTIFVPNALFMPDVTKGCAPLTVTFSDSSSSFVPLVEYIYDYGNGQTGTFTSDAPHTFTYTEPGEYEVQLTVRTADGCRDSSYTVLIEVGAPTPVDFSIDPTAICIGDSVQLTPLSMPAEVDEWHFSTDNGRSFHCPDVANPEIGFITEAGDFDVTLYTNYNGCIDSLTKAASIEVNGPVVNIDYEIDCDSPLQVSFGSVGQDIGSLSWDFGDGTTGTGDTITHTYAETGDYLVSLTATNAATGCAPYTDTLTVHIRQIKAEFSIEPQICQGTMVDLNAEESVDVHNECWKGYTWFFEINGRPIQSQDSVVQKEFGTRGDEIVGLVVEDINGCRDTLEKPTRIYGLTTTLTVDDNLICIPSEVSFMTQTESDTTLAMWEWDFGDGVMITTMGPNIDHTYTAGLIPGQTINAMVTIKDVLECQGMGSVPITIYQPFTNITTDPTVPNICVGETVNFSATDFTAGGSSLTFNWDFGNGQTATGPNVSSTFTQSGSFNVNLTFAEVGSGCGGVQSVVVNVQDYPTAAFTTPFDNEAEICYTNQIAFTNTSTSLYPLTFFYDFGNGQSSQNEDPQTFFGRGTYTVTLTAETTYGCSDDTSRTYTFVGPEGDFSLSPTTICLGESVTVTLEDTMDVTSFTWDFGDGTLINDQNPVTHAYTDPALTGARPINLILRGEDAECVQTVTREIFIRNVTADFELANGNNNAACEGEVQFVNNSTDADTYFWTFGNGQTSTQASPAVDYAGGVYTVRLIASASQLGCRDTIQKEITVIEPMPWMDVEVRGCPGQPIEVEIPDFGPLFTLTWSPAPPPEVLGEEDLDLTLTITDVAGCFTDSYTYRIISGGGEIQFPDVFSPNGDEINDSFRAFSEIDLSQTDLITIEDFRVFNRWGQPVYRDSGPDAAWNGQVNDKPAPADVYIYRVLISFPDCGEPEEYTGEVTLMR